MITFYQNTAEANRVYKTPYLTKIVELNGTFKDATSVIDVVVQIEYDNIINFNYAFISEFNRYYIVEEVKVLGFNRYEVKMSVDVLMTYYEPLKKLYGFVERSEVGYDPDILDKKRVVKCGQKIESFTVLNDVFLPDGEIVDNETSPQYGYPKNGGYFVLNGYSLSIKGNVG